MSLSGIKSIITYRQVTEPTSASVGDVWMHNGTTAVKVYNGSSWDVVIPGGIGYGYIVGGYTPTMLSTIDRITFPFDSGTASHVGNLNIQSYRSGGCNSSSHGFSMGGQVPPSTVVSTINRILFPFNSGTASNVGSITGIRFSPGSCNSSIHGYSMGGYTTTSIIDRILFPFNSGTASTVGNLSGTR